MSASFSIRFAAMLLGFISLFTPLKAMPLKFLAWDDAIAERKIGLMSGTEVSEIQGLHPHKRSAAINWQAVETPPALVALDRTAEDGKPVTITLKIAPDLKSPLVLLIPDTKHPTGLRCFVMEDAAASFEWGTVRFINATGREIMVRKEKIVKALPETPKTVDFKPGGAKRNLSIQMAFRTDLNAIIYSSVWEHDPDVRKLVIVVPGTSADGGALDLKIIPEDRRTIAAAAESPSATQAP